MKKLLELDYRKYTIKEINNELKQLIKGEVNEVHIENIHPSVLEDEYSMEIDDENGFDMDWWGHFYYDGVRVGVFGSGRYGYASLSKG